MRIVSSIAALSALGIVAAACAHRGDVPPVPAAEVSTAQPALTESSGSQPLANYKDEQKRLALRGLDYESGFVTVIDDEAREVLSEFSATDASAEFARGRELLAANRRLDAVAAHSRAVLLAPEDARMYEGLGDALITRRWNHRAIASFRTGLLHAPDSSSLHAKLADAQWRVGEHESAIASAEVAIQLDPQHGRAHARLAVWRYYTGDPAAAWRAVHAAEGLGESVPPQFRALLAGQMTEPAK